MNNMAFAWPPIGYPLPAALTSEQATQRWLHLPSACERRDDPRIDFTDWAFWKLLCPERLALVGWPDGTIAFFFEPFDPHQRDASLAYTYIKARERLERAWISLAPASALHVDHGPN